LFSSLRRRLKAILKLKKKGELLQGKPEFEEIYCSITEFNPHCPKPSKFIFKTGFAPGQPRADRPTMKGAIFDNNGQHLMLIGDKSSSKFQEVFRTVLAP
jgi:hypothetical protein